MDSNPKAPKVIRTTSGEQEGLSSLPESILCHILSFLPTKYAAMTSILSKRWRYLFLGVSNIDIDEYLLLKPQEKQGSRIHENRDFIEFVTRRLIFCKTSITEFRLKCRELPELGVINKWLTALFFRNVKVLEIEQMVVSDDNSPPHPLSGIFWLENLVVLKLCRTNVVLKIPEFVSFPNLKVLHVSDLEIQFESDCFRLAEGYPLLEDLRLEHITYVNDKDHYPILGISIPTLKTLVIIGIEDCRLRRIDIDTPHLQDLECSVISDSVPVTQITCCKCESLVSAKIYGSFEPTLEDQGEWFVKFLSKLNNVKELRLADNLEVFNNIVISLPSFPNLSRLEFDGAEKLLWTLLQHAPNLEELDFSMEGCWDDHLPRENVPLCVAQTLREITTGYFRGCSVEFEVLRFFLQHGAVLERMIIHYFCQKEEQPWPIFNQLLNLGRLSPKCEIKLA